MPSSAWRSDVCSSDRSEEHTSELQSQSNLVCRIIRSEENTSELQSQSNLVCRLLLEKKKNVSLVKYKELMAAPRESRTPGLCVVSLTSIDYRITYRRKYSTVTLHMFQDSSQMLSIY